MAYLADGHAVLCSGKCDLVQFIQGATKQLPENITNGHTAAIAAPVLQALLLGSISVPSETITANGQINVLAIHPSRYFDAPAEIFSHYEINEILSSDNMLRFACSSFFFLVHVSLRTGAY